MKACKKCFNAAVAGGKMQKLCAFCEKGVEILAMEPPNEVPVHWVFRSKHSKPLEQCSLVSLDDKRVQVLRLSDGKKIWVNKRIRSSQKPLAMRNDCNVIENKRRGKKPRDCNCRTKVPTGPNSRPDCIHASASQAIPSKRSRPWQPPQIDAKLAKRGPYEDKDIEESDFEWPKLWFSKSLFWIIFPNFFVMSFSA